MPIQIQPQEIDKRDYWQFRTEAPEWLYLLHKIINSVKYPDEQDYLLLMEGGEQQWTYLLKRSVYSRELIVKTLGLVDGQMQVGIVLDLDPPPHDPDLPEPTVSYYGEA